MTARRGERGAAAVEWAIAAPLFVLILGVMVAGWRLNAARSELAHSAEAGARAASLERSAAAAAVAGSAAARKSVDATTCPSPAISVDTAGFAIAAGNPADVTVTLHCRVPLADLLVPGLPGSVALDASATTPLDRYRSRR